MNMNVRSYNALLIVLIVFSGIVACEGENESLFEVQSNTPMTPSSKPSTAPNAPQETIPNTNSRSILGEVVSINEKTYTVKDPNGKSYSIEATSSTLVDQALTIGDMVEVRFSDDHLPIAIRKVRTKSIPGIHANESIPTMAMLGELRHVNKEQGLYVITTAAGEEKELRTNFNSLIDGSIRIGDKVKVTVIKDEQSQVIAIRKVRSL